jgi:uncharacterized membrane protein
MNFAHIHLVLNHIPIIGIPVALVFLAYGMWTKHAVMTRFSLLVLAVVAVSVLPVYLTGEPAEEVVEHLPGVGESFIESHEDAGKLSFILTLITGSVALLAFFFHANQTYGHILSYAVIAVACAAVLSLAYTANLGGQIRHTEFRTLGAEQP